MNSDQRLVAWLAVTLILIVLWTTYRNDLKNIFFTSPTAAPSSGGGFGTIINPFNNLVLPTSDTVSPGGTEPNSAGQQVAGNGGIPFGSFSGATLT